MPRRSLLTILAFCLACERDGRPASNDSAGSRTAPAGAESTATRGVYVDGDERAEWVAARTGSGSRIDETARFGDDGTAKRTFIFDASGALVRMTEERAQTVFPGNQSPTTMHTTLSIDFTGGAPTAVKSVDGKPGTVQEFEINNVRRRATALRRLSPR